ncbi:enoyl-CoA hydratase-related protein [Spirillospora sp. NPDC047418]|jgi:enoyl-CoA hydratase/carnithine racemase
MNIQKSVERGRAVHGRTHARLSVRSPPRDAPGSPLITAHDADPDVRLVRLERAEALALTVGMVAGLSDALADIGRDRDCRRMVLTGAGRAFCTGLDLTGHGGGLALACAGDISK